MPKKKVAVVEPRWWGHHPAFTKEICKCLLSLGADVLCLCPDGQSVAKQLEEEIGHNDVLYRFKFDTLNYPSTPLIPSENSQTLESFWLKIPLVRTILQTHQNVSRLAKDIQINRELIENFHTKGLTRNRTTPRPNPLEFWSSASIAINRNINGIDGWPVVFFTMLSEYLSYKGTIANLEELFPYDWSGLVVRGGWLHGSPGDAPIPLMSKNFRSLFFLDEQLVENAKHLTNKPAFRFPEISYLELQNADDQFPLLEELKKFKRNRYLIGVYGIADRRKGIFKLLEIARRFANEPIAFAIIGDVANEKQSADLEMLEHELTCNNPGNLFYRRGFIENEREMNSIIDETDLLWLAYLNYPYSSNQLTKAAACKTPSVVNIGGPLANRVEKFGLGLVIPIANLERSVELIRHCMANKISVSDSGSSEYLKQNNESALRNALSELLN